MAQRIINNWQLNHNTPYKLVLHSDEMLDEENVLYGYILNLDNYRVSDLLQEDFIQQHPDIEMMVAHLNPTTQHYEFQKQLLATQAFKNLDLIDDNNFELDYINQQQHPASTPTTADTTSTQAAGFNAQWIRTHHALFLVLIVTLCVVVCGGSIWLATKMGGL